MDFSSVVLDADDLEFLVSSREFLSEHVTEEVRREDRETGDNFDEDVHLALGKAGYLERLPHQSRCRFPGFAAASGNWRSAGCTPWVTWGTTQLVAHAVEMFGTPELVAEVLPKVFSGEVRMCLGYTEPEGGSDIATCKTRAVRDGDAWVINGSKMFTTGAHNCQYVFFDHQHRSGCAQHKSLSMFLVPLDLPASRSGPAHHRR